MFGLLSHLSHLSLILSPSRSPGSLTFWRAALTPCALPQAHTALSARRLPAPLRTHPRAFSHPCHPHRRTTPPTHPRHSPHLSPQT